MSGTYYTDRALLRHTITKDKIDPLVSTRSFTRWGCQVEHIESDVGICYECDVPYLLPCVPAFGARHERYITSISTSAS